MTLLDLAVDGESVLRQQVSNKKVWTSEADSSPFSNADIFFFLAVSYIYFACIFQIHKCIGGPLATLIARHPIQQVFLKVRYFQTIFGVLSQLYVPFVF